MATPAAEVEIDIDLVARLLGEQAPEYSSLPLRPVGHGWDNAMFRIGDELAVRLPRRAVAVPSMRVELTWLATLPDLGVAVPKPTLAGEPSAEYPWPWSIVPWFEGEALGVSAPDPSEAARLGDVLRRLHRPAPDDAPSDPHAATEPARRPADIEQRIARASELLSARGVVGKRLQGIWRRYADQGPSQARSWVHSDLHPRNLIARDGKVVALIDWGDLCAGDPANDLAAAWLLFDTDERRAFFDAYGHIASELIDRSVGRAATFATVLFLNGLEDDPVFEAIGFAALKRLVESE